MDRYVIRRVVQAALTVVVILVVTFVVVHFVPGDPFYGGSDEGTSLEAIEQARRRLGLDQPLPVQLMRWFGRAVRGDLGVSTTQGIPVTSVITQRLGPTLILTGGALILSSAAGVFVGLAAARRTGSVFDRIVGVATLLGYSVPGFWLAQLAVIALALKAQVLPSGGYTSYRYVYEGWRHVIDVAWHAILPVTVMAVSEAALLTRMTRTGITAGRASGYARTALAKGLPPELVMSRHVLRNSLLPLVTIVGQRLAFVVSGSVVIENVFSWPGLGSAIVAAAVNKDRPLLLGIALVLSLGVIGAAMLTDMVYAWADPRVRRS